MTELMKKNVVGVAGLEPASAAYQAITEYRSAALPIELHPQPKSKLRMSYQVLLLESHSHAAGISRPVPAEFQRTFQRFRDSM